MRKYTMAQEPVSQSKEEIQRRAESGSESKVQEGSSPKVKGENQDAPRQEKAPADPNE